jgi:hypothetical protein
MRLSIQSAAVCVAMSFLACSPAQAPRSDDLTISRDEQAIRVGSYLGAWLGYFPGYQRTGQSLPDTLNYDDQGVELWVSGRDGVISITRGVVSGTIKGNFTSSAVTSTTSSSGMNGALGDVFSRLGTVLGGSSTSSGTGSGTTGGTSSTPGTLPTAPGTGASASLPTAPASGAGTIPTTPVTASASLPAVPAVGAGSTVQLSPASYGSAAGGTASAADLGTALCTYVHGFIVFLDRCLAGGNGTAAQAAFDAYGGCSNFASAIQTELGVTTVPAQTVKALKCVGTQLESVSCAGSTFLNTALTDSLASCGIAVGS